MYYSSRGRGPRKSHIHSEFANKSSWYEEKSFLCVNSYGMLGFQLATPGCSPPVVFSRIAPHLFKPRRLHQPSIIYSGGCAVWVASNSMAIDLTCSVAQGPAMQSMNIEHSTLYKIYIGHKYGLPEQTKAQSMFLNLALATICLNRFEVAALSLWRICI